MAENVPKLSNPEILDNLNVKLGHLIEMELLLLSFKKVFGDIPNRTTCCYHDVNVGDSTPVKQHPYRMNPIKLEQMKKEIDYMLQNNIIEPSSSEWSSPYILVPKPNGTLHFCTDFHKLNSLTKTDTFPLLRRENYIDKRSLGAGAVLIQNDSQGFEHPMCYFCTNLTNIREYILTLNKRPLP